MKTKLSALMFLLVIFGTVFVRAQQPQQKLGAGILLGSPSSLVGKYWVSQTVAWDVGLAFSFDNYILIHSNYLTHYPGVWKSSHPVISRFVPYLGIGGVIVVAQKDRSNGEGFIGKKSGSLGLGVRIPLGVEWLPPEAPLGIYLELAPGLALTPSTTGFIQGGLGVRYYF